MRDIRYTSEEQLDRLQFQTFNYFWHEANSFNGLVAEKNAPDWPAGLAATGLALTSYPVAVERGFVSRQQAAERTLVTLKFFRNSRHGHEPEASGYHGFYYRLLDLGKGRRARMSELAFLETAILLAGALTAASYFVNDSDAENEIRNLADELYLRADWQWALDNGLTMSRGWKPETGFLKTKYEGYDEALLLYILGMGSPSSPLSFNNFTQWTSTYQWVESYGFGYLHAGPLLVHQLPQIWIDFRDIRDRFMKSRDSDYFINSETAARIQQKYAIENTGKFIGYGKNFWGISISDGPCDPSYLGYARRGVISGPDDGTISPWTAVASLPFAPDVVLPMIDSLMQLPEMNLFNSYGFKSGYNPTFVLKPHKQGWKSSWHYAVSQGPSMPLIENHRSGLIWEMIRSNKYFSDGLRRAGFIGGWLNEKPQYADIRQDEESV